MHRAHIRLRPGPQHAAKVLARERRLTLAKFFGDILTTYAKGAPNVTPRPRPKYDPRLWRETRVELDDDTYAMAMRRAELEGKTLSGVIHHEVITHTENGEFL